VSLCGAAARRSYLVPVEVDDAAAELNISVPIGLGSGEAAEFGVVRDRFLGGSPFTGWRGIACDAETGTGGAEECKAVVFISAGSATDARGGDKAGCFAEG
jgi:hypothetical protein